MRPWEPPAQDCGRHGICAAPAPPHDLPRPQQVARRKQGWVLRARRYSAAAALSPAAIFLRIAVTSSRLTVFA